MKEGGSMEVERQGREYGGSDNMNEGGSMEVYECGHHYSGFQYSVQD